MRINLTQERLNEMFSKPDVSVSVSFPDDVIDGVEKTGEGLNRVLRLVIYAYLQDYLVRGDKHHLTHILKTARTIPDKTSFGKKKHWRYMTIRIPYNLEIFIKDVLKKQETSINDFLRACMIYTISELPEKKWVEG